MSADAPVWLADLGGTHLRLARLENGAPHGMRLYRVAEWPDLSAALADYAPDMKGGRLVLSFAKKYNAEGIYRLDQAHKGAPWSFSADGLKETHGLARVEVLHDFYAMALALFHPGGVFENLWPGAPGTRLRAVIGVGTGIGHALADPGTGRIYDTFGGHFPPCAVTDEQNHVLKRLRSMFTEKRSFIFEEILSGRGLHALYRACGGQGDDVADARDPASGDAVRLFTEFLGLYANVVCTAAHAFGGVYLTGGVIDRLRKAGRFNVDAYQRSFHLDMVPIVDEALRATPLYMATDDCTGLYGLAVHAQKADA